MPMHLRYGVEGCQTGPRKEWAEAVCLNDVGGGSDGRVNAAPCWSRGGPALLSNAQIGRPGLLGRNSPSA
jgi:hypothetical protein